jgi:hypothetical protein
MIFLYIFIAHLIVVKLLWLTIQKYCKTAEKRWQKAIVYVYFFLTPYKLLR